MWHRALVGFLVLVSAALLHQDVGATLVGEAPGEKPNSYGEIKSFTLPHSQLVVQYSTKFFRMPKDGDPLVYAPDLEVVRTLADMLAGRDPVLAAALAHRVREYPSP